MSVCHCGHELEVHEYDNELDTYYECSKCECEGYDLNEYSDAKELEF